MSDLRTKERAMAMVLCWMDSGGIDHREGRGQDVVPCTSGMLGGERMFEGGNFEICKKIVWEV